MVLLHDIMEGSDCGQVKDLISDRSRCVTKEYNLAPAKISGGGVISLAGNVT